MLENTFTPFNFYDHAFAQDFSRDFQLRVLNIGNAAGKIITPEDNVFITTASLPKYKIHNQVVPFMGMNFNIPGTADFDGNAAWQVTFRCDLPFNIKHAIETWQHQIFTQFEQPNLPYSPDGGGTGQYNVPESSQTIELILHDRTGEAYRQYSLIGCYPVEVGDVSYNQTGEGKVQELPVTLAYQWWVLSKDNPPVNNNMG